MKTQQDSNPFRSPSSRADDPVGEMPAKRSVVTSFFTFTNISVTFTLIFAAFLIGSAIYNVALWQDGASPPRDLSGKILGTQAILVGILFLMAPTHLVATVFLAARAKARAAATACIGFISAAFAFFFTMIYDQGSIFFQ